jgi:hypothetical protein
MLAKTADAPRKKDRPFMVSLPHRPLRSCAARRAPGGSAPASRLQSLLVRWRYRVLLAKSGRPLRQLRRPTGTSRGCAQVADLLRRLAEAAAGVAGTGAGGDAGQGDDDRDLRGTHHVVRGRGQRALLGDEDRGLDGLVKSIGSSEANNEICDLVGTGYSRDRGNTSGQLIVNNGGRAPARATGRLFTLKGLDRAAALQAR